MILYYIPDEVILMLKSKKGIALPMVVIAVSVLILLGLALYGLAVSEATQSEWQIDTTQAQYMAQSGVNVGVKIMDDELDTYTFLDTETVAAHMNELVESNIGEYEITGTGSFTIEFEAVDALSLKITSVGKSGGSTKVVTMTTDTSVAAGTVTNPSDWVSGINLTHSVTTGENYLGHGVTLEGNPIQSPQGGLVPSTFQASAILFTDYQDLSLQQINNSVDITFDSEVLYFHSGVELTNLDPTIADKNDILFSFSDSVVAGRPVSGRLAYATLVGLEDIGRYRALIDGVVEEGYVSFAPTDEEDDYYGYYSNYAFDPAGQYGVVRFGGDVTGYSGDTIPAGYYFFNGVAPFSLKYSYYGYTFEDLIDDKILIPIVDYDPAVPDEKGDILIPAIDRLFKLTLETTDPQMWNYE